LREGRRIKQLSSFLISREAIFYVFTAEILAHNKTSNAKKYVTEEIIDERKWRGKKNSPTLVPLCHLYYNVPLPLDSTEIPCAIFETSSKSTAEI
jgi:hypothetical protein